MAQNSTYALPRVVIALLGWGATYWVLTALSTHLLPVIVYITGIAWVLAGIVLFGYLYKVRRELVTLQSNPLRDSSHECDPHKPRNRSA